MEDLNTKEVIAALNKILQYELSGVVRYTHYSLMVTGRDRLNLAAFFKAQASESLVHAQEAGELVTGLEGHPSMGIPTIEETNQHSPTDLLKESLEHELYAVSLYKALVKVVDGQSIYIEEYARGMIKAEEMHSIEIKKMLRDIS